jgi:hypothetical protein
MPQYKTDTGFSLSQIRRIAIDTEAGIINNLYGIFMDQKTFKFILGESSVDIKLVAKDMQLGDVATPYNGLNVFVMPEEEKYISGREWFIVTHKEYEEYMRKVEEIRKFAWYD